MAERLLQVPEGLGHDEPAEVGDQVGQGVRPTAGPEKCFLVSNVASCQEGGRAIFT